MNENRAAAPVEFAWFSYEGRDEVADALALSSDAFSNPILAGFYPDPSICRVGDDFYLVNSSFSYFPGVPLFHSVDLVHWTQIGHVLDRPSQANLDGLPVSSGIYAPAIRYYRGVFYVVTTNVGGGGNFYVTAQNPAGPWSDPHWLPQINGIDPSFFFDDDGRAYIVHNGPPPENRETYDGHRALWLWEFDVAAGAVIGDGRIIVDGGTDLAQEPIWIEGPHLFQRNGFYYLIAAEGGTGDQHSEVVFRSRSVWGPYEARLEPILTQRDLDPNRSHPVTCVGHADFVETEAGEWWAVFLGCRPYQAGLFNTGRETFLLPVTWENDWPVILEPGEPIGRAVPRPALGERDAPPSAPLNGSFTWRDDFNQSELGLSWNTLRAPRNSWRSLTGKPGSLSITPRPIALNSSSEKNDANASPSFIARRQQHAHFTAVTMLAVTPASAPCDAGLAALQNDASYFFLGVRINEEGAPRIFLEQHAQGAGRETLAEATLPTGVRQVELKMEATGRDYAFSFRAPAADWVLLKANVDGSILSTERAGGFVGTYIGLYARTCR